MHYSPVPFILIALSVSVSAPPLKVAVRIKPTFLALIQKRYKRELMNLLLFLGIQIVSWLFIGSRVVKGTFVVSLLVVASLRIVHLSLIHLVSVGYIQPIYLLNDTNKSLIDDLDRVQGRLQSSLAYQHIFNALQGSSEFRSIIAANEQGAKVFELMIS